MSTSGEQEQIEFVPRPPSQDGAEATGEGSGAREAPVLPVSQPSPPQPPRPAEGAAEREEHEASSSASVSTQTERPPRGVSNLWGLDERLDSWQISSLSEEKHYFSMDPNLFAAAVTAIKSRLSEADSNIRGSWLVTEVNHWDLEKEKMLILTDISLISVRYNFIIGQVEELKFIPLTAITDIVFGDFKYPSSYGYSRTGKALKIFWGKEENVGFLDRWNPFSTRVPYTIFASHLMLRKGRVDSDVLRISTVIPELERAINDLRKAQPRPQSQQQQKDDASGESQIPSSSSSSSSAPPAIEEYHVKEEDVVIGSIMGVSALVHNGSNLGFFKRRGLVNW